MSKQLVGKARKSTRYRVEFPTLPSFAIQPEFIELRQVMEQHDVLQLTYTSNRGELYKQLRTGVPVKLTWTQGSRKKTWYGYVSVTTETKAAQTNRPTKVYCIGASFLLKESKPRIFQNKTVPEVAAIMAKEVGLRFVGENTTFRWSQLSITTESYWEWLQEHARIIGYVCYVDGVDLIFRPIDKVLYKNTADLPIMQYWGMPTPSVQHAVDRTLDSIQVLSGEYVEWGNEYRTNKQVGGVDPISGKPFLAVSSPATVGSKLRQDVSGVLFTSQSTFVANNYSWAKEISTSEAQLARFTLPAKLVGQGDPRMHPYGLVYVDGTGQQTDGAWLVKTISHKMNRAGEYSAEISAATDGLGSSSIDYESNSFASSRPLTRSVTGKINIESYLSSAVFNSSTTDTSVVKLPSGARTSEPTATLKNVTNIDHLIQNKVTMATPGITATPHIWRSRIPGNALDIRR
jgi:hypothetical protein